MCKLAKRWGIALAVVVAIAAGPVGVAGADEDERIVETFKQGITLYETGNFAGAREAFDGVLAMKPDMKAALKMRDLAEFGQFAEMKDNEELREQAEKILDLMTRAARQRKRDVTGVNKLVQDLQSTDLATYGNARVNLVGHGPYAVPYVVGLLTLDVGEEQAVVARAISLLAELHRDACLPLIRVLRGTDSPLLQVRVAQVLGQIGDGRAVAALMAVATGPDGAQNARDAAAEALQAITGMAPAELGSAAQQYMRLGMAYFNEDKALVGYTYGLTADIWEWDAQGAGLAEKVVYEEVPNYLYYQRMAVEVALDGLALAPDDADLQALLAAGLVRELALCMFFKSADVRLGGEELEQQVRQDAADRVAVFAAQAPVVVRMLQAPVVAQALQMALEAQDGPTSLFLVKTLGDKLAAGGPGALDPATAEALVAALRSGDKDVRYNAGIALVAATPTGELTPAPEVMAVMGAALKAAADRNALVIMDNFQMRNKLANVLRKAGVATADCGVLDARIEYALSLEPSVDIIFLAGNVAEGKFARILALLKADPRTKAAPLCVVVDPMDEAPKMSQYDGIADVLTPDGLRAEALEPMLAATVFAESRSAFTDQEEALVLKAARAVLGLDPRHTDYPLAELEPSLIRALTGYSEEVSAAAVAALAAFGSQASAAPLGELVAGGGSLSLRVSACRALAAVLGRSGDGASERVVAVLIGQLASHAQVLREAAAEALSAAGLAPQDVLALIHEGLGGE